VHSGFQGDLSMADMRWLYHVILSGALIADWAPRMDHLQNPPILDMHAFSPLVPLARPYHFFVGVVMNHLIKLR
jgi:hypothetical protein